MEPEEAQPTPEQRLTRAAREAFIAASAVAAEAMADMNVGMGTPIHGCAQAASFEALHVARGAHRLAAAALDVLDGADIPL